MSPVSFIDLKVCLRLLLKFV